MPVAQEIQNVKQEKLVPTKANPAVEVVSKLREGEMPSNTQLRQVIDRAETSLEARRRDPNVTPKGEQMISHASQFLDNVAVGLEKRNADEQIQRIMNASGSKVQGTYQNKKGTVSRDRITGTVRSLGSTVLMLARSGDFRTSIIELLNILDSIIEEQTGQAPSSTLSQVARGETPAKSSVTQQASKVTDVARSLANPNVDVHLSDDQRSALFNRLANTMHILSSRTEFKDGIYSLLDIVDHLVERGNTVVGKQEQKMSSTATSSQMEYDIKNVVEQFTGNKSIDPFLNSARRFISDISRDVRMKTLFSELREWIEDVVDSPKLLENRSYQTSIQDLFSQLRTYSREYHYDKDFQKLSSEARMLLEEIRNDQVINDLRASGRLLLNDFTQVGPGNQRLLDLNALAEMKDIIAPIIIDQLENVPVPRIEGSDETYDYVVDNVVFSAKDILPDNIQIKSKTKSKIGIQQSVSDKPQALLKISVKHITTQLRNVKFFFKRKAFPKLSDEGTVDVDVGGKGANLKLWMYMDQLSAYPQFSAYSVQFILKGFDLHFRKDTKHTFLLNTGTKFFRAPLEKRIETAVTEKIEGIMDNLLIRLNQYLMRLNMSARQALKNNPVAKTIGSGVVPIGPKRATTTTSSDSGISASRVPTSIPVRSSTPVGQLSSSKHLKDFGYLPGSLGGAAVSMDEVWKEKVRLLRRMGYKVGTPGGFAAPLDGDLYKWAEQGSMWNGPQLHQKSVPQTFSTISTSTRSNLVGSGSQTYIYGDAPKYAQQPQHLQQQNLQQFQQQPQQWQQQPQHLQQQQQQPYSSSMGNVPASSFTTSGYGGSQIPMTTTTPTYGLHQQQQQQQQHQQPHVQHLQQQQPQHLQHLHQQPQQLQQPQQNLQQQPSSSGEGLSGFSTRTLFARDWQGDTEPSDINAPLTSTGKWDHMKGGGYSTSGMKGGIMEDVRSNVVQDDPHRQ